MNTAIGAGLAGLGILAFWTTMVGVRLKQPPFWTGDTFVMCFITPLIIFSVAAGVALVVLEVVAGNVLRMRGAELSALAIVLVALGICSALVSLWSRRSPRAEPAQVIPLVQPAAPDPVHPKPAPQSQPRKAA